MFAFLKNLFSSAPVPPVLEFEPPAPEYKVLSVAGRLVRVDLAGNFLSFHEEVIIPTTQGKP